MRPVFVQILLKFIYLFQAYYRTGGVNVISIDTPWKTICSVESGMAGLIIPDADIKKYGGSLGNANEKIELKYSIIIESVKIMMNQ